MKYGAYEDGFRVKEPKKIINYKEYGRNGFFSVTKKFESEIQMLSATRRRSRAKYRRRQENNHRRNTANDWKTQNRTNLIFGSDSKKKKCGDTSVKKTRRAMAEK